MKTLVIDKRRLFFLIFIVLCVSCATPSYPPGGPVDRMPPKIREIQPPQGTLNFKEKSVYFHFDEYLSLENIQTELLCSPPMEEKPKVELQGKTIKFTFNDELKPNTTYRLYFGKAIADNNEKNVLESFSYTFSTGTVLDSMIVDGYVYNAFTLKPEEGITVGLYMQYNDSIVFTNQPYYVSRTNKEGYFSIQNIQGKIYKLFALKDLNNNLKYDLATEEIAFSSSSILSKTSKLDSTNRQKLYLFIPEKEQIQRITSCEFVQEKQLLITATIPFSSPAINVTLPKLSLPLLTQFSENKDSLFVWIQDTIKIDTVLFEFNDNGESKLDTTIKVVKEIIGSKGKKKILSSGIISNHPFFAPLELNFTNPLKQIDSVQTVQISSKNDTVFASLKVIDEIKRKVRIEHAFKQGENYRITIYPNTFVDIYDQKNDTLVFNTRIDTKEDYGEISFTVIPKQLQCQYIIQLVDEKDNVKKTHIIKETTILLFQNLLPGKYRIKVIEDSNCNEKWDSGNYWENKQPEKVYYFSKQLLVRANWAQEESFEIAE